MSRDILVDVNTLLKGADGAYRSMRHNMLFSEIVLFGTPEEEKGNACQCSEFLE